jgi:riboflavin transporter FmnP
VCGVVWGWARKEPLISHFLPSSFLPSAPTAFVDLRFFPCFSLLFIFGFLARNFVLLVMKLGASFFLRWQFDSGMIDWKIKREGKNLL